MAIRTAKAVVEEVPSAAQSSVASLAACRENNSERDTGRVAKRFGLKLPIPLSKVQLGSDEIPFLKMSDWATFILQAHLWHRLCGLTDRDQQRCCDIWQSFWTRYRKIEPNHPIYKRPDHDLSRTCALLLHGDEGRPLRKSALMVISTHSILGFGLSTSKHEKKSKRLAQKLNYEQPTWTTRFLLSVLPKSYYSEEDDASLDSDHFQDLMDAICIDLRNLYDNGIETKDGRFYFCVVKVMGDWPFIQKCGSLSRTFMNISKAASSRAPPKGICHLCCADMTGVEWENFHIRPPTWVPTVNTLSAFLTLPKVLQLPMEESFRENFFCFDLFHAWHLGAGKTFLASCLAVLAISSAYQGSVESRLEKLNAEYIQWKKATGFTCQLRRINRAKLGWSATTVFPAGTWSKGSTTTCLMRFFLAMCQKHGEHVNGDLLLRFAFGAAKQMDCFLHGLYSWELWIPSNAAKEIAVSGANFLKLHGKAVQIAHSQGQLFFLLMPNFHRIDHLVWDMETQAAKSNFVLNPLYCATQSDEDFIGRPSRLSRRVSPRLTIQRTLERSLVAAYAQYVEVGALVLKA